MCSPSVFFFFFFNDTATTEIYTLSLHDALPISDGEARGRQRGVATAVAQGRFDRSTHGDRKSTRLNSSHSQISYAVFCLKKKKNKQYILHMTDQHLLRLLCHDSAVQRVFVLAHT